MPNITRAKKELKLNVFSAHPPGIKFVRQFTTGNTDHRIYVLEREPTLCRITFNPMNGRRDSEDLRRFKIKLPWVYFIGVEFQGTIHATFIWFAKNQAKDLSEPVFLPPFPNIKDKGNLCLGEYSGKCAVEGPGQVESTLARILRYFFGSKFNPDIWVGPRTIPAQFRRTKADRMHTIFEDWEKRDKEGVEIEWKRFRKNPRSKFVETIDDAINYAFTTVWGDDD
jgi:hypothetical protein